jgi:hypothetical protein
MAADAPPAPAPTGDPLPASMAAPLVINPDRPTSEETAPKISATSTRAALNAGFGAIATSDEGVKSRGAGRKSTGGDTAQKAATDTPPAKAEAKPATALDTSAEKAQDTAKDPSPAPAQAAAGTTPASESPADQPAATPAASTSTPAAAPSPPATDPAAEDFTSREWRARFAADPTLERVVKGIAHNPQLSLGDKAERIHQKVAESEDRVSRAQQAQADLRDLRRTNAEAYVARLDEIEAESKDDLDLATRATRFMAQLVDVDPDDPDFVAVGPKAGEDPAVGIQRLRDFLAERSPLVKGRVSEREAAIAADHEAALASLKADHEAAVKQLEKDWGDKLKAAVLEARAEARGQNGSPPRATVTTPPTAQQERLRLPTIRERRSLLAAGFTSE